jgi:hypothetical protein
MIDRLKNVVIGVKEAEHHRESEAGVDAEKSYERL